MQLRLPLPTVSLRELEAELSDWLWKETSHTLLKSPPAKTRGSIYSVCGISEAFFPPHFGTGVWLCNDFHMVLTSKQERSSMVPTGSAYFMI